jgi:hypothetical protein
VAERHPEHLALALGEQRLRVTVLDDGQQFVVVAAGVEPLPQRLELLAGGGHVELHRAVLDSHGELRRQRGLSEELVEGLLDCLVLRDGSLVAGVQFVVGDYVRVAPDALGGRPRVRPPNFAEFQRPVADGRTRQQAERRFGERRRHVPNPAVRREGHPEARFQHQATTSCANADGRSNMLGQRSPSRVMNTQP